MARSGRVTTTSGTAAWAGAKRSRKAARSGKARAAIRRFLRQTERDETQSLGRKLYDEVVSRLPAPIASEAIKVALTRLKLPDEAALMEAIARRRIPDADVMEALMPGSVEASGQQQVPPPPGSSRSTKTIASPAGAHPQGGGGGSQSSSGGAGSRLSASSTAATASPNPNSSSLTKIIIAQVFFLRDVTGDVPRSRPLGLGALAILAIASAPLTLIVGIAASTAVLVAVAIADTVREGSTSRRDRPADSLGSGSTISEIATRPHEDWSKHGQVRSRKPGNR